MCLFLTNSTYSKSQQTVLYKIHYGVLRYKAEQLHSVHSLYQFTASGQLCWHGASTCTGGAHLHNHKRKAMRDATLEGCELLPWRAARDRVTRRQPHPRKLNKVQVWSGAFFFLNSSSQVERGDPNPNINPNGLTLTLICNPAPTWLDNSSLYSDAVTRSAL